MEIDDLLEMTKTHPRTALVAAFHRGRRIPTNNEGANHDALDHIMRVAKASRTQTRRLRWIAERARCALEGKDDWREIDLPKGLNTGSNRLRQLLDVALEHEKKGYSVLSLLLTMRTQLGPPIDGDLVECVCGDSYPANSYGAGYIHAAGHCPHCTE